MKGNSCIEIGNSLHKDVMQIYLSLSTGYVKNVVEMYFW